MKLNLTISVLFLLFLQISFAQNIQDSIKTDNIETVLVTGTRTERNVATLPLPTQVITGESIQKTGLSRLNEIIQEQTGLIMVPDFGGGEGIQLQGLDAAYVMILIDGQPLLGRSAGTLDLSRISVNNIDRIEIVKGASSCLYGSEALAGVVNIITKKPQITDKLIGNITYKMATFNTHDISTNLQYGKNKISGELFGNYYKTNGFNLTDNEFLQTVEPYHNFTFQPKIRINFSGKVNLLASTRMYFQNQDYKTAIDNEKYEGESKINEWNHALLINQKISDHFKLVYDFYATNYKANEYLNDSKNILFDESKFNQWFYRPEIRSHYTFGKNTLTTGIGINSETLDRTYFENKAKLNSEYVFGQFEWYFHEKWNVLAGFRYDHHHQYQSQLSPKIAVNYKLNENLSLKTSIGYGYKAPDLRQLYFDFTNSSVGYTVLGYNVAQEKLAILQNQGQILFINAVDFSNPLKPESSVNANLGGYFKKDKLNFDFNFFYNTIENLIDTKAIAQKTNGQNVFSYFNIDKIFTHGLELNSTYTFTPQFSISMGYQYLTAKDQNIVNQLDKGEIFARDPITLSSFKLKSTDYLGLYNRSKHTANIKANYLFKAIKTSINARVFYRSKYGIFDTNDNGIFDKYDDFVKGYFLTNIAANKDFKYGFSLQVGVNNVFGYTDKSNISNLTGRQYFSRIQYQF